MKRRKERKILDDNTRVNNSIPKRWESSYNEVFFDSAINWSIQKNTKL